MRIALLLLAGGTLLQGGCSTLVVTSGQNLPDITGREQAHKTYGTPDAIGECNGHAYEEFTTHRKIAEKYKSEQLTVGYWATLGLGELVWFPQELFIAARRSIVGQKLRFTYDETGRITQYLIDGNSVPWIRPLEQ